MSFWQRWAIYRITMKINRYCAVMYVLHRSRETRLNYVTRPYNKFVFVTRTRRAPGAFDVTVVIRRALQHVLVSKIIEGRKVSRWSLEFSTTAAAEWTSLLTTTFSDEKKRRGRSPPAAVEGKEAISDRYVRMYRFNFHFHLAPSNFPRYSSLSIRVGTYSS